MSINIPHPHAETNWQAVAMFLAGVITEEKPEYTPLIMQVVEDCTKITTSGTAATTQEITA